MIGESRRNYLTSLRDQIARLRVVKCRMTHERVVGSADSMQIAFNQTPTHYFKRVGLCSPGERAERLGCSHTMSRSKLDNVISELGSEEAERLRRELNWLTNEIHLLDHRKGEAEARLAVAEKEATGRCGEEKAEKLARETEEVRRLERKHDVYVERVGELRDRAVAEIERMIGKPER